jgi:peptidoglycan/LPS O-acetylase OafA/YrhL
MKKFGHDTSPRIPELDGLRGLAILLVRTASAILYLAIP